jgi:hypothetical protein
LFDTFRPELHAAFVDTAVLEASQVPFLESRPATSSICGGSLNVPIWSTSSVRLKSRYRRDAPRTSLTSSRCG